MKKLLWLLFGIFLFISCETEKPCEKNNTGNVVFTNGESSWSDCYLEVTFASGEYDYTTFFYTVTYSNVGAGTADLYMEWEDALYYYWTTGSIYVPQCGTAYGTCYWNGKKSAETENIVIKAQGKELKSDYKSRRK